MITEKKDGRVVPALIINQQSAIIGTGITNEKGYRKSIEQGEAWLLDGESGKLLPDPRVKGFLGIMRRERNVEIRAEAYDGGVLLQQSLNMATAAARKSAPVHESSTSSPSATPPLHDGDLSPLKEAGRILADLESLLYERKQSRPEGSYTTHLFESGEEKIRKKAGEEAVEFILANENEELASEAADLMYHVMVLFVQRGMSLNDAIRILWQRR